MALEALTAKANTGAGTDQLAVIDTGSGKAGAVALVDEAGELVSAANPLDVSVAGVATQTTLAAIESYFKAEDSAAVSGEKGLPMLAMRQLADTTSTDTDGDYTLLKIDEEGRVKVATKPASFTLVTGDITASAQKVFCDVSRASNVRIAMVAASLVGHNSTFEGSIDSTNGTDGNWFGIQVIRSNANTIELTTGVLAATPAYMWRASVNGLSFIRVRATAHTSGTATWKFQRGSFATEPIPAAQVSGTQPVSNTPVTPTQSFVNSAASTNATVVKASAGTVWNIVCTNANAAARYVKFYNVATSPTVGTTVPVFTVAIPASSTVNITGGANGIRFGTGISLAITTGIADSDTGAVAANEIKVATSYT